MIKVTADFSLTRTDIAELANAAAHYLTYLREQAARSDITPEAEDLYDARIVNVTRIDNFLDELRETLWDAAHYNETITTATIYVNIPPEAQA